MAEPVWVLLCEHAIFDEAGRLSVFGITRKQLAAVMPAHMPKFTVAYGCRGKSGERTSLRLSAVSPTGRTFKIADKIVHIGDGDETSESFITVTGLTIPEWGRYRFEVTIDGRTASALLFVGEMPSPSGAVH